MLDGKIENPPVEVAELGAYTEITEIDFPTKAETGKDIPFSFTHHLKASPPSEWTNLAYGVQYADGPQSSITIDTITLSKGDIAYGSEDVPSVCHSTKTTGTIKALKSTGRYTFKLLVGHVEGDTFYADTSIQIYMDVSSPTTPSEYPTFELSEEMQQMLNMMIQLMMTFMVIALLTGMVRGMAGGSSVGGG